MEECKEKEIESRYAIRRKRVYRLMIIGALLGVGLGFGGGVTGFRIERENPYNKETRIEEYKCWNSRAKWIGVGFSFIGGAVCGTVISYGNSRLSDLVRKRDEELGVTAE